MGLASYKQSGRTWSCNSQKHPRRPQRCWRARPLVPAWCMGRCGRQQQHGLAVLLREFFEQTVAGRLVAVRPGHWGAQLVGYPQARHAADEFQGDNDAGQPIWRWLRSPLCSSCNVCRLLLTVPLGVGITGFRSKSRAAYASFESLRTLLGCPPSKWNAVRHPHGIVSAISWNTHITS